jgi:tRNA pseudouridine65 synthase
MYGSTRHIHKIFCSYNIVKAAGRQISNLPRDISGIPLGKGVVLIARDRNGLLAVEKPCNTMSHPNTGDSSSRALINCSYSEKVEAYTITTPDGADRKVYLLNRLDSGTSGVLLLADDNPAVARAVREQFSARVVNKCYYALVLGHPTKNSEVWKSSVRVQRSKDGEVRLSKATDQPVDRTWTRGGAPEIKLAESRMHVLKRFNLNVPAPASGGTSARLRIPLSVIELKPVSGYTHQLRYQCAERGWPIVGDKTYGNFVINKKLLQLAAATADSDGNTETAGKDDHGQWLLQHIRRNKLRLFLHCHQTSLSYTYAGRSHSFSAVSTTLGDMLPTSLLPQTRQS